MMKVSWKNLLSSKDESGEKLDRISSIIWSTMDLLRGRSTTNSVTGFFLDSDTGVSQSRSCIFPTLTKKFSRQNLLPTAGWMETSSKNETRLSVRSLAVFLAVSCQIGICRSSFLKSKSMNHPVTANPLLRRFLIGSMSDLGKILWQNAKPIPCLSGLVLAGTIFASWIRRIVRLLSTPQS